MQRRATKPLTVLVTGVGGGGVGMGIVEALRHIKRSIRIVGTDITPYSVGLFRVDRGCIVPPARDESYLKSLLKVCAREKVRVVIPGTEPELLVLTRNTAVLAKAGLVLLANEHTLVDACLDKWTMHQLFVSKDVRTPAAALPGQADAFIRRHGYPFLIKARKGSGSRHLSVVRHREDFDFFSRQLASLGVDFILCEYVGSADQEYTVGVISRQDRSVVGSITVHRLVQGLSSQQSVRVADQTVQTSTGISQGLIMRHPAIQRQCEEWAVKLGVTGPANFQGRLVGGEFVLFELNPRFSGTTPFRAAAGFNDPELMLRERIDGELCRRPRYRTNLLALRSFENVFIRPAQLRRFQKKGAKR